MPPSTVAVIVMGFPAPQGAAAKGAAPKGAALFTKVVVAFCAVLVPLYLLGSLIYLAGAEALRNRLLQAELSQLQSSAHRLDQEYEHVATLQENYVENYRLRRFAVASGIMTTYDRVESMLAIQDDLTLLCAASPIVADATVDFPALGRRISRSRADSYTPAPGGVWQGGPRFMAQRLELSTVYPPNAATAGVQFVLSITLDAAQINGMIAGSTLSSSGQVFFTDDAGAIVSGRPRSEEQARAIREAVAGAAGASSRQFSRAIGGTAYLVSLVRLESAPGWLASISPEWEILGPLGGYRRWFWALTAVTLCLGGLFAFWISSAVRRPIAKLMGGFREVEAGDLGVQLSWGSKDEFGYLFAQFNAMAASLDATLRRCVEQESLARHAELLQLQSQIKPHFLYNSIYHIYRMARDEDVPRIERYAQHLGSYFEFITRGAGEDTSLAEEARHAGNYSEVQRIRFQDRITVDLGEVPERLKSLRVPRLIVQPLLENAYNHGLKDVVANGVLVVRYRDEGSLAAVTVEDNGKGMTAEEMARLCALVAGGAPPNGVAATGIMNIHRRLALRFGPPAGVRLEPSTMGGLKVSLILPAPEAA